MRTRDLIFSTCLAVSLLATAACAPPVDLGKNVEVVDVVTGWSDAGITEDGQNKLVPFLQFKLKNNSDRNLPVLQVNATFRPLKEEKEWGSRFQAVAGSEGLAAGATTTVIRLTSDHGVKGTDPRAVMMKSNYFVDARAQLSAKYGATQWTKLTEYPIAHTLVN
jgi:hypothetical protein